MSAPTGWAPGADWVRAALRCPQCRGELADGPDELICNACQLGYPVRGGIPVLLIDDARELDGQELGTEAAQRD